MCDPATCANTRGGFDALLMGSIMCRTFGSCTGYINAPFATRWRIFNARGNIRPYLCLIIALLQYCTFTYSITQFHPRCSLREAERKRIRGKLIEASMKRTKGVKMLREVIKTCYFVVSGEVFALVTFVVSRRQHFNDCHTTGLSTGSPLKVLHVSLF